VYLRTENDKEDWMKAVIQRGHGGPEVLQMEEVDTPVISRPHEVLVRVRAAGVNPADWQARKRPFAAYVKEQKDSGLILGLDGAGVVDAVGTAVSRFKPGDAVYYVDGGFGIYPGSYAEFKLVDEHYLARKPSTLGFEEAAALPVVLLTVWEALYERAGVKAGDFVLVHGGAGGLGHIGIQLAKRASARVATTVSSEAKANIAIDLGAEKIIRYREENVREVLSAWTGKDGADVVFDTVGHDNFARSFDLVAPYGVLLNGVVSNWPSGDNTMAEFKNIRIAFENMGLPQVVRDHAARLRQTAILEEGARVIDEGGLRVLLDRTYPITEAGEAQRAREAGEITGRVVLAIA
jgi:NADPH:quinone reductase-like Zn-dependent oxidoreductase